VTAQQMFHSVKGRLLGLDVNNNLVMRGRYIYYGDTDSSVATGVVDLTNPGGTGGGGTFASSVSAALNSGAVYSNFTPAGYVAGTTNRLRLTPTGANQTIDGIVAPATDGFVILITNESLLYNLIFNDQNFAGNGSSAGNKLMVPNPNGLSAAAIQTELPPQGAVKLTYVNNMWVFA
jgi:hypothetical protein